MPVEVSPAPSATSRDVYYINAQSPLTSLYHLLAPLPITSPSRTKSSLDQNTLPSLTSKFHLNHLDDQEHHKTPPISTSFLVPVCLFHRLDPEGTPPIQSIRSHHSITKLMILIGPTVCLCSLSPVLSYPFRKEQRTGIDPSGTISLDP